jgi:ComF family protein
MPPLNNPPPRARLPFVKALLRNAVDFLYPPFCILCDTPLHPHQSWFCTTCDCRLHEAASLRDACPRCAMGRRTSACACSLVWDHPYAAIHAIFSFDDSIQKLIHQIKYKEKKKLAWYLGKTFSRTIPAAFIDSAELLVPVPLHFLRTMQRGYNQAEYFCRGVATGLPRPIPIAADVIRRRRNTHTQTRLNSAQRRKNLAGAFVVRSPAAERIRGRSLLLVDDVVTTGTTVSECAEVLLKAGAGSVRVLTLARA